MKLKIQIFESLVSGNLSELLITSNDYRQRRFHPDLARDSPSKLRCGDGNPDAAKLYLERFWHKIANLPGAIPGGVCIRLSFARVVS